MAKRGISRTPYLSWRVLVTGMKRVRRWKSATRWWSRKENRSQAIFRRNFYWYARHVGSGDGGAAGIPVAFAIGRRWGDASTTGPIRAFATLALEGGGVAAAAPRGQRRRATGYEKQPPTTGDGDGREATPRTRSLLTHPRAESPG